MAGFIEGVDRGQSVLFPDRLDDWIGEDSLVGAVDLFVDELDLLRLGFARSVAARTGRPYLAPRYRGGTEPARHDDPPGRGLAGVERAESCAAAG